MNYVFISLSCFHSAIKISPRKNSAADFADHMCGDKLFRKMYIFFNLLIINTVLISWCMKIFVLHKSLYPVLAAAHHSFVFIFRDMFCKLKKCLIVWPGILLYNILLAESIFMHIIL